MSTEEIQRAEAAEPTRIQRLYALAEAEENPHVLARALGRTLDDYAYLRQLCVEVLNEYDRCTTFDAATWPFDHLRAELAKEGSAK